ncbi:MAG: SusD/RagB family nutrient-binding outer membrane lipoprotein [Prevotellaceae bacterium]|jgi:hypothetical protein|nr:SusD/RagB family nutrient-binding outer membrane lipoprotein [Prevotellaceae bacterium]
MIQIKSFYRIAFVVLLIAAFQACTGDFEKINRKPYEVTGEEMERDGYNIGASLIGLQNLVIPTQENLHQFVEALLGGEFGGYIAAIQPWGEGCFATYNPPINWNRVLFNDVITGVYPYYDQLRAITDDPVALALAQLYRVAAMHRVTDAYGPIPYSKVGASENSDALATAYDSQEDVYKNMLADLNEVIRVLTENRYADASYYAKFDNVYSGVIERWAKLANSLKLRIAIRMAYAAPALAKTTAEEAVGHPIGVIVDNADNAFLQVVKNPWDLQVNDWNDARANADIVSYMNGYQDPRREKYFTLSTFSGGGYVGMRGGVIATAKDPLLPCSKPIVSGPTEPMLWMNAAEVAFLKAEGAWRGWNMGGSTAEALYNEGITLSFGQYGLAGANDYLNNATSIPAAYTYPLGNAAYNFGPNSGITIKWDNAATDEQKLERIITQKWIAIFPLGNEAWAEFRRTGYPKFATVVTNSSNGTVAAGAFIRRLVFPDTEYQRNAANVAEAVRLLGGPDSQGTKLWWDKKN